MFCTQESFALRIKRDEGCGSLCARRGSCPRSMAANIIAGAPGLCNESSLVFVRIVKGQSSLQIPPAPALTRRALRA